MRGESAHQCCRRHPLLAPRTHLLHRHLALLEIALVPHPILLVQLAQPLALAREAQELLAHLDEPLCKARPVLRDRLVHAERGVVGLDEGAVREGSGAGRQEQGRGGRRVCVAERATHPALQ